MPSRNAELIAEARKCHKPEQDEDGTWCFVCSQEWPCQTLKFADALEVAEAMNNAQIATIAWMGRELEASEERARRVAETAFDCGVDLHAGDKDAIIDAILAEDTE